MFTTILDVNEFDPDREAIFHAAKIIRSGGLVAFPTETVYGLGADATDSKAAEKIYKAKGRPSDNPLIIHISDPNDYKKYAYPDKRGIMDKLCKEFMPGPLTVVLKKKDVIPYTVTGGLDTVAVRCPANKIANTLISVCGVPIAAPSPHLSGSPSPTKSEHVITDLDGRIDMILCGGSSSIGLESTIIMITDNAVKLLRPGFITKEELETVCGTIEVDKAVTDKLSQSELPLAPGMKYKHYAPKAELVMLAGDDSAVIHFFKESLYSGDGVVCFDEDIDLLPRSFNESVFVLGPKDDPSTQAKNLFDVLRAIDKNGLKRVYTRSPSRKGVGLAVFNRLIKACGYQIISAG